MLVLHFGALDAAVLDVAVLNVDVLAALLASGWRRALKESCNPAVSRAAIHDRVSSGVSGPQPNGWKRSSTTFSIWQLGE